jgi:hypothetical protein
MHNNHCARLQPGADGGLEVVLSLDPQTVAAAEDTARRLNVPVREVLETFFAWVNDSAAFNLPDNCLSAWQFPTREAAEAFRRQEGQDPTRYGIFASGDGFAVEPCGLEVVAPAGAFAGVQS